MIQTLSQKRNNVATQKLMKAHLFQIMPQLKNKVTRIKIMLSLVRSLVRGTAWYSYAQRSTCSRFTPRSAHDVCPAVFTSWHPCSAGRLEAKSRSAKPSGTSGSSSSSFGPSQGVGRRFSECSPGLLAQLASCARWRGHQPDVASFVKPVRP